MNKKTAISLLVVYAVTAFPVIAQVDETDEIFELSPFTVEGRNDRGYRARNTLAGTRVNSPDPAPPEFSDLGATINGVDFDSIAQYRQATGVRIQFGIGFYDDLEKTRRDTLIRYLDTIQKTVRSSPDLIFEPGALLISPGDRKKSKDKRRSSFTSYAYFSVSFDLVEGSSPFARTEAARRLIGDMGLESEVTKLFYGFADLTTELPYQGMSADAGVRPYDASHSHVVNLGGTLSHVTDALGRDLLLSEPRVPTTLIRSADSVRIAFAIDFSHDVEATRIATLNRYLDQIEHATATSPGLRFEPGALLVRRGDRPEKNGLRRSAYASQAQFAIRFDLADQPAALDRIRSIRRMISAMEFDPDAAKVTFGAASLVVNNPNTFRSEIVTAIYADLASMAEGLGEQFEIEPTIESARVQLRQHSPTEVEVWIPYTYTVISVRERKLLESKLLLDHELALSKIAAANRCCHEAQKKN